MSKKLILIDGHSILNRAFYGIPDLTNNEGIHTNAMYGFLNIMFKFIDEEKPDYITVAFDLSAPTFRHKTYDAYKGTRKPMLPELKQQVPLMKELLKSMNITVVEKEGYEADDLLGTLAKKAAAKGIEVSIISGDRDLLQLADTHIKIRIPKTKKGVTEVEDYYPENVEELYSVTPTEFIDVKALMGDTSDNIPGAPGIGPKTASALIAKYHNIDNIFEDIENVKPPKAKESIKNNIEQIKLSKFLATIDIEVPIDFDIENAAADNFFNENSYELFKRYDFKNMLKKFDDSLVQKEPDCYQYFVNVTDFSEAENIFARALELIKDNKNIGLSVIADNTSEGSVYSVSITLSEKEIFNICCAGFITEGYITDKIITLADSADKRQIVTNNMKDKLLYFSDSEGQPVAKQEAFFDTAIALYLLHPNIESYDYETIAREFMNITVPSFTELAKKRTLNEIAQDEDTLLKIACLDSYINYMSAEKIKNELISEDMYTLFETIEMPLVFVLFSMQQYGIRVDKEGLNEYSKVLKEKLDTLEKEIYDEAGEEFNINSPKQLGVILFEKLNLPNAKKTKSGYSTAADVLDKLAPDYPIVQKILDYRQMAKLKSTYADGLAGFVKDDGRIHGKFNQTITATGRISSTDPNLQNIPIRIPMGRQIRKVFIPEDGYEFIDADYSQIELRILAHMSGDEKLIEAYNNAQDIHRTTASQVFNVPFEEVTPELRRNAKAVNFGIIYGMSSFGLSQDLSISPKEAKEYIEKYFNTYPDIKKYIDSLVESAKEKGYSLTMFNRRRQIPELSSGNFMQRSFGERVAMNAPIQGSAADIIKLAMISVYKGLKDNKLKSRLILQVHDELLVETYKDEIEQVKKIIDDGMRNAAKLKVALEIDMKEGKNWLEAH
ncbi:MAG: DNA polymerase I [Lachnospira sp.]|nr:DNA polymerase I [Lachnospira sp.]